LIQSLPLVVVIVVIVVFVVENNLHCGTPHLCGCNTVATHTRRSKCNLIKQINAKKMSFVCYVE
jgi:hypothetical protein